jgi:4-amino-4-deoxy-L-arabinose transferase-like glycosyltransferase
VAKLQPVIAVPGTRPFALSAPAQLALLLLAHTLLWTWVGVSSRSNFDSPGDMVEAYAWAQGWQWGYFKHPPLSAWIAGLWFSVVPESDWGYSLLAALNGAIGLAGLALLAREFLPRPWVLLAVALASLAPGITTLAMRFNANAVLISTWPWALALTVRLMRTQRGRDAVLCGLAWALALLGKYFSGVLLLSVLATALWLPAWRARLLRGPVLLATAVFLVCMAPHLSWLLAQTQGPLQYAQAATAHEGSGASVMRALSFALAQGVFPLLAVLALFRSLAGPSRLRAFFEAASSPLRPRQELVWLLAVLPIAATMAATVLTGARTASVWGLGMAAGLALLAASRAHASGAELDLGKLWRTLGTIWLLVAVLSPMWWYARASLETPAVTEPREELALEAQRLWHTQTGTPLNWVSGTRVLAASTAFYAPDQPGYWSLWNATVETPWVDLGKVSDEGGVILCATGDTECERLAEAWSADRRVVRVAKSARGFHFRSQAYVVYLLIPQVQPAPP